MMRTKLGSTTLTYLCNATAAEAKMLKLEEVDVDTLTEDLEEVEVDVLAEDGEEEFFLSPNPEAHVADALQQGRRVVRALTQVSMPPCE